MIRFEKNRKGQAVLGEYAVVIAMVLGVIVAMTIYFKRAVQAKIYDARNYMVNEVRERTSGNFSGDLYVGYEPYYTNTSANISRSARDETRILPGGTSGIFQKEYNESVSTVVTSETLPPRDFNATTPPPAGTVP